MWFVQITGGQQRFETISCIGQILSKSGELIIENGSEFFPSLLIMAVTGFECSCLIQCNFHKYTDIL